MSNEKPPETVEARLEQALKRITSLERSIDAVRIRNGLENASRIFRKSKTVIFVARECGGDGRFEYFGDNIKYAYLAFLDQVKKHGIRCYFLTDSEKLHQQLTGHGLPCLPWFVPHWTSEHVRIVLEAKIAVLCNVFYPLDERGYFFYALLRGAKFVQLWHGIPLKEIGMECVLPPVAYRPRIAEVLGASGPYEVLVGSSSATRDDWSRRFAFHSYEPVGYPRTDVLFRDPTPHEMINVDLSSLRLAQECSREKKPFILYAPTFRVGEFGVWFQKAGMEEISEHAHCRHYTFAVNLHPFEAGWIDEYRRRYPYIHFIQPLTDIYPILRHVSVMITDYSSIVFDFLLCDWPVVFYRPDHQEYVSKSRGLITDHEKYLCGAVTEDAAGLKNAIDSAVMAFQNPSSDAHAGARKALRERLYDHVDGKSGERLSDLILRQLDAV